MSADWLDSVLVNRPAVDEGFADRVIAVDRAHRRTTLLLRALGAILFVGFSVAALAALPLHAIERWNTSAIFEDDDVDDLWLNEQRDDYRAAFTRLDQHPDLARRTGKDASAVLDPVVAALDDADSAIATACAVERAADAAERDRAESHCDTSFINGLAAFDEWRRPPLPGGDNGLGPLVEVARTHLRRAADVDGASFAAAARDVTALGRLTLGHAYLGIRFFTVVNDEHKRAAARGRDGGFVPSFTKDDIASISMTWLDGIAYAGAAASDDDVAFVAAGHSVLSCSARADVEFDLMMQEAFVDDARTARTKALSPDGCGPRNSEVGPWLLCGDAPSAKCSVYVAALHLPLIHGLIAKTVTTVRFRPESKKNKQGAL